MMKTIRAKVAVLIAVTSLTLIVGILTVSYSVNKKNVTELCESYLYDTCVSASNTLYESFYGDADRQNQDVRLQYILYNVGIQTMDSSKAYLVDKDGIYLYHDDASLVGTQMTGNDVVQEVLDKMNQEGLITTADVCETTIDGEAVYIAYMCTVNDWVIFVRADAADVMRPVNVIAQYTIVVGVILVVVAIVIGLILVSRITKPITQLTAVINDISKLDLQDNHKIPITNDEIGIMGEAVEQMKEHLSTIVGELNGISGKLVADSNSLYTISEKVSEASTDNSATNEELAASMESTSNATDSVAGNVQGMNANAASVAAKISDGTVLTSDIMQKTQVIYNKTKAASEETFKVYERIKSMSEEAIVKAKEVDRINVLANAIQEIADQTTLLSLNASIEAARAGEAGKGFAVVASEIGSLASESTKTGADIVVIVEQVNSSVETLTKCLVDAIEFLQNKVMNDYNEFMLSSNEYSEGTKSIEDFMLSASAEVNQLESAIAEITKSMDSINQNVGDCSIGISDIADKTTNVVELINETFERTSNCKVSAEELQNITSRFQI